jgi:hypothetical protein
MRALPSVLLAGLLLVAAPAGQADLTPLTGTVGPDFTIGLKDASGRDVHVLRPGRYAIVVHDLSDQHNFVLGHKLTGRRPIQTEVAFVGDLEFTVDLPPGLWVFACSPHFQTMNGTFIVEAAPTPAPAPRLVATVTSNRLSLAPKQVSPGRYIVTVADRSATRGFRLVGPGINRQTGRAFTGTARWSVRLRTGVYRFGDQRTLTGRLVVR